MKFQLPFPVEYAKRLAIIAGVCYPPDYFPPYSVKEFSTLGKTFMDFSWEKDNFPAEIQIGRAGQFVYAVYCNDERFSRFFLNKRDAKELRDSMNIRHFNIAKASLDCGNPVLI